MELHTPRLVLRSWRDSDIAPFATQCADPRVMAFFERPLLPDEVEAAVHRYRQREADDGFCMWAVELPGVCDLIGVAGIQRIPYTAPFTPAVEVGWRFSPSWLGRGYATEAAHAALAYGFGPCGLREIVAIAVPANTRSLAVMDRLGMQRDTGGDFDHPSLPEGHRWRRHALYRLAATGFVP